MGYHAGLVEGNKHAQMGTPLEHISGYNHVASSKAQKALQDFNNLSFSFLPRFMALSEAPMGPIQDALPAPSTVDATIVFDPLT